MRPRIQLKVVTEQMKYLEEQMQLMEPVISVMKNAIAKSKTWMEDINDNPSITYIELCHELNSATTALLDAASNILSENKEPFDVDGRTPSSAQYMLQPTAIEKEVFTRLGLLENSISCLQSMTQKTKEDTSEIKQWRDNFVTEQSDMGVNIEWLTKKQKQNFKNLRKLLSKQDNNLKELKKEIESFKEKETKSKQTLEKLSIDVKEYVNNIQKIKIEMQGFRDIRDGMKQDIQSHYDFIVSLQYENNKNLVKTSTGFEKIQSKLGELENTISKLSGDFHLIESRVCNRYACHVTLANSTPVSDGSIISRFGELHQYNGQHFNQTTGTFVSPNDGLYLVCVSLDECEDKRIGVVVVAGDKWCKFIEVKCADTSAAGTVVVDLKKGQELYFKVFHADPNANLSCYSSFAVVSL